VAVAAADVMLPREEEAPPTMLVTSDWTELPTELTSEIMELIALLTWAVAPAARAAAMNGVKRILIYM
jgi:hypothetical protein